MSSFYLESNPTPEVFDSSQEDLIVTNRDGIIIKASKQSGAHYGLTPEELLGASVYDLEERGIFTPAITPLVMKEKKKVVLVQETPSGSRELIMGFPLFDGAGDVEFVVSYSYEWSELLVIQEYLDGLEAEMASLKEELSRLRKETVETSGLILSSRPSLEAFSTGFEVAELDVPVMVYGEHGTGKSTLAKEIHKRSGRKDQAFLSLDCRTIPEALFERELVGDGREKIGLLSVADGGTLYLEGIDRLPLHLQTRLAALLKDKEFRVGDGPEMVPFDVRLICSAEGDLAGAVKDGEFLCELYYMLQIVPIELRPLMERREDLTLLIPHFLEVFNEKHARERELSQELFDALMNLPWPGNIDELQNVMERLVVSGREQVLRPDHLPMEYRLAPASTLSDIGLDGRSLPSILESVEKRVLKIAKQRYGTTTEMAKQLGISQPSVVRKLKKYEDT
ncbi:sigma 54-interacting transcriptional regulator [Edaphobacillus lindanitolerans]|uniref:HTH-type transcriptional regulatory protein TyrR n=1 Tax=Edaphobacillus lindanitolerans TaxID=550447 RepID=A0A1U7PN59_9BACI|nr:sigma 54-interacting transcriptional regulator [Edaphobacillus lindanitolerans]SIT72393.1 Transcriptional regulator containing PAS, AAA-type ATPase, and DNA-binding Fis domains [Edaphobacillus lindanitolerans]